MLLKIARFPMVDGGRTGITDHLLIDFFGMIQSRDPCSHIKQFLSLIVVASITKFCWIVVSEVLTI